MPTSQSETQLPLQDKSYIVFSYTSWQRDDYLSSIPLQKAEKWDRSINGLVQINRFAFDDYTKILYIIDDKINNRTTILRDDNADFDDFMDSMFSQIREEIEKVYGDIENSEAWDYEIEYYRAEPGETFTNREDGAEISIMGRKLGTEYMKGDKGGIRVFVDLKEVLDLIYNYIYENYKGVNVND